MPSQLDRAAAAGDHDSPPARAHRTESTPLANRSTTATAAAVPTAQQLRFRLPSTNTTTGTDIEVVKVAFEWALDKLAKSSGGSSTTTTPTDDAAAAAAASLLEGVFETDGLWAVSALGELAGEAVIAANEAAERGTDTTLFAKATFLIEQLAMRHATLAAAEPEFDPDDFRSDTSSTSSMSIPSSNHSSVPHGLLLLLEAMCDSARWGPLIGAVYECALQSLVFGPTSLECLSEAAPVEAATACVGAHILERAAALPGDARHVSEAHQLAAVRAAGRLNVVGLWLWNRSRCREMQDCSTLSRFDVDARVRDVFAVLLKIEPKAGAVANHVPTSTECSETLPDLHGSQRDAGDHGWFEAQLADELVRVWQRWTQEVFERPYTANDFRASIGVEPILATCRWRHAACEALCRVIDVSPCPDTERPLVVERMVELAASPVVHLATRNKCLAVVAACVNARESEVCIDDGDADPTPHIVDVCVAVGVASLRLDTASPEQVEQQAALDTVRTVIGALVRAFRGDAKFAHDAFNRIQRLAANGTDPRDRVIAMLLVATIGEGSEGAFPADSDGGPSSIASIVIDRLDPATEASAAVRFYAWRAVATMPLRAVGSYAVRMADAARADVERRSTAGDLLVSGVVGQLARVLGRCVALIDSVDADSSDVEDADTNASEDDGDTDDDGPTVPSDPDKDAAAQVLAIARESGIVSLLAAGILDAQLLGRDVPSFVRRGATDCFSALAAVGIPPSTAERARDPLLAILSDARRLQQDAPGHRATAPVTLVALDGTTTVVCLGGIDAAVHADTVNVALRALTRIVSTRSRELEAEHEDAGTAVGSSAAEGFEEGFLVPAMAAVSELRTCGAAHPLSEAVRGTFAFWAAAMRITGGAGGARGSSAATAYVPQVLASCFESATHLSVEPTVIATGELSSPLDGAVSQRLWRRLAKNKVCALRCIRRLFDSMVTPAVERFVADAVNCCCAALQGHPYLGRRGVATPKEALPGGIGAALDCLNSVIRRHFAQLASADLRTELAFRVATKGPFDRILAAAGEVTAALDTLTDYAAIERHCMRHPRHGPHDSSAAPVRADAVKRPVTNTLLQLCSIWLSALSKHVSTAINVWERSASYANGEVNAEQISEQLVSLAFDATRYAQSVLRLMPFVDGFIFTMRVASALDGALTELSDRGQGQLLATDCRLQHQLQTGLVFAVANHFTPWVCNRHKPQASYSETTMLIMLGVLKRCAPYLQAAPLTFEQLTAAQKAAAGCIARGCSAVGPGVATSVTGGSPLRCPAPAAVVHFLESQPNLRSLAITGEDAASHCAKVRSAFCSVSRLRRHVRAMELPTSGSGADLFTVSPEELQTLEQTLCAELASHQVLDAALGFLGRDDLAQLAKDEGLGTATNVCSAVFALGGGRLAWQEDGAFPDHPFAPRPPAESSAAGSSTGGGSNPCTGLSFMCPVAADFPYARAVELMTPFLSGRHDTAERPVLHHDLLQWLTDAGAPAYAALVATDDAASRAVAAAAVEAVLPAVEGPLRAPYTAALAALKRGAAD